MRNILLCLLFLLNVPLCFAWTVDSSWQNGVNWSDLTYLSKGQTIIGNKQFNGYVGFYGTSPISQPTGDICTAMQNLGLVSSCTESGGSGSVNWNNFPGPTTNQTVNWSNLNLLTGGINTPSINGIIYIDGQHYPYTCAGVQAAINTVSTYGVATIMLPPSIITCTSGVSWTNKQITIQGASTAYRQVISSYGSLFVRSGGYTGAIISYTDTYGIYGVKFADFAIYGADAAGDCMDVSGLQNAVIQNVAIQYCGDGDGTSWGLHMVSNASQPLSLVNLNHVDIESNDNQIYIDRPNGDYYVSGMTMTNSSYVINGTYSTGIAVDIVSGESDNSTNVALDIDNSYVESNQSYSGQDCIKVTGYATVSAENSELDCYATTQVDLSGSTAVQYRSSFVNTHLGNGTFTDSSDNPSLYIDPTNGNAYFPGNISYGGRIIKRVTTYSNATSITPDTDTDDISYMANTKTAGTFTVNNDSGTGRTNGQSWILKISSTAIQTFSWGNIYGGGTLGLPSATTGTGKIQYFAFVWDSVNDIWDYTGTVGGY